MYDQQQIKELQELTAEWLSSFNAVNLKDFIGHNIESLRNILRFHEYNYYVLNDSLITDFEYDSLYKQLEKLEKENPSLITPDSPTQRVGSSLNASFKTVHHIVPMLSLENSYNAESLYDWDRKARELTGLEEVEYCIEPKFDGAGISLIYENDLLQRAATRGDGVEGEEITNNIKQIKSIPLSAKFSKYNIRQIEIRGEVMMNKNSFKKYNEQLQQQNLPPLANPRNAAAGSLRMKNPKDVGKRNLEAFLYHVSYLMNDDDNEESSKELLSHSGTLEMLWNLGFYSPKKIMKVVTGIDNVVKCIHEFEKERDNLPYEIDGMVIKVNKLEFQEKMGMTAHHPRWAIAFKFKARQATSKLLKVEFQVGRTGSITPVAKIEPVHISGVIVSSISLFNEDVVKEKDLRIGDTVLVERAGDVIPYIAKPLIELRDGKEKPIVFPTKCPVCNDELYKPEEEAVWRCVNINCQAQVVERIIHFVSKDAMDIKSFGEANVRKFYELGLLKDVPGIYQLDFDSISMLEGFGERSIDNLRAAIKNSKQQPLHRLIFALGIRYVGETTAKTLANTVEHLLSFKDYSEEQLQNLDDVGVKVAASIYRFFHNDDNIRMLQKLKELGLQLKNNKKQLPVNGNLTGQTFLFTGTLIQLKRTEAEALVEKNGGKIASSVTSKLNYLVTGIEAGSKLEKAKKITSVKIISEEEFVKMLPH
jgi:DNA ligase (NAD+)